MKILIAVDGADCSARAVDFVTERPWSTEDRFLVVTVVEPIPQEYGLGYVPPPSGENEQHMYDDCAKVSGDAAAKIKSAFPTSIVEVKVANGFVAETLTKLAETWGADLLILGSHGRKGLSHFFLGSVAEEVLKKAPCSVEVIKLKQEAKEKALAPGALQSKESMN